MNVGFIGTGSMGTILVEAFLQAGALQPGQILVYNRTISKAERLAERYTGIRVSSSSRELASESDILFLCVKPSEFIHVVQSIRHVLLPSQIAVSITSPVLIRQLEDSLPCKVAKIIPSITNYVRSGATLCTYGERMNAVDRERLETLFAGISKPIHIAEEHTRITSDLSSCGPAFFAYFIQKFCEAAVEETGIAYEEAVKLASEMLLGTGKLLTEGGFTPESLRNRVSVPGGITEQGIQLLNRELDGVFHQLIRTTHGKFTEDLEKIEALFYSPKAD